MRHLLLTLAITLSYASAALAGAIGTWNNYMAYHDIEQVEKAGKDIFVLASGGLYQYTPEDGAVFTYDKIRGLSDTHIDHIAWNATTRRLIAVYDNSNIDLVETNGNITNISDLYNKMMVEDKTVNSIFITGRHAYLATNFGGVKVDTRNATISESYILGFKADYIYTEGNNIFLSSKDKGLYSAPLTANLQDKSVWQHVGGFVDKAKAIDPDLLAKVKDLQLGGPKNNNFYYLKFVNDKLYSVGGKYTILSDLDYPGTVQVMEDDKWTFFQDRLDTITGYMYSDNNTIDIDPVDPSHVFAAGRCGLYEFENGRLKNFYNKDNSPLDDAKDYGNNYVIINSICFDHEGNLWVLNSLTNEKKNILRLKKDGTWEDHHHAALLKEGNPMEQIRGGMIDSRGLLWFCNDHWDFPALVCYDPTSRQIGVYNTFTNQDGTNVSVASVRCVAEDHEGNIWCGTNAGPLYLEPSAIVTSTSGSVAGNSNVHFTQFKVPRNDGTNYADYLLANVDIQCITVDDAGRKWFGTSNGAYLISRDNLIQEQHFEKNNSGLLSDIINSIAINGKTGEVFFATDKGLCSYMGDATTPSEEMTDDNVYAYPNPVEPSYTGLITVVGLTMDADVKVTTATGYLVYEGRSNGGTFTWDGCDRNGRRVASGVYNVITAKSDGSKGTVCKVAIVR